MPKLTFDDVMEMIAEERQIDRANVSAKALQRTVWVAEWHVPGCLSESRSYCTTKKDAIESALMMADSPRGMKTSLQKYGRFDCHTEMFGTVINTVENYKLSDII